MTNRPWAVTTTLADRGERLPHLQDTTSVWPPDRGREKMKMEFTTFKYFLPISWREVIAEIRHGRDWRQLYSVLRDCGYRGLAERLRKRMTEVANGS